jgi:SAM-dependent methyltransferase
VSAADEYRARIAAVAAQRQRLIAPEAGGGRWDREAKRFRMDPNRELDPNLAVVASFVEEGDVLLDIGGGAGRMSLPLARRCREVVSVDPSPGMCAEFQESAAEAGITNARTVQAPWPAPGLRGDIALVFNVTYFVGEVVPFIQSLVAATRRRVVIGVWSVPPPDNAAGLFEVAFGEPQERVPGHRELLPVLWEMGILPDVRVLPSPFPLRQPVLAAEDEVVQFYLAQLQPRDAAAAVSRIRAHFGELFTRNSEGFLPTWREHSREILITWET